MARRARAGVGSMAAGPVDHEAKERGRAGKGEEEGVAKFREIAGAEGELKALDGTRRDVELGVAVDGPVNRAEKDLLVAGVGDAVDFYAVFLREFLERALDHAVLFEKRTGAGGEVGS